jgi:RNA polymerase sigma-70 factor (ECF subfamily)
VSIDDHSDDAFRGEWLESELEDAFTVQKLADGVRRLPAMYQEVIILRFINQLSHAEVAGIMNVTESHVRVLQYRALKLMREKLKEDP